MSVLFVSNFLSGSGLNRVYSDELCDRLESRGWEVTRTSPRPGRLARLADMLSTAWARRGAYALAHVDVFSGPAFLWAEAVAFELRRLGKPYVLTLRGGNLPEFARRWPRRVRALLRAARLVTVPSGYLAERMRPYCDDLSLYPNAIDVDRYGFALRARPAPRLVWLRALHAIYNPTLAIDVLARLSKHYPGATLRMIGPDKGDGSRAAVERRARELGVDDRVELVGRVPKAEVSRQLATADVFLNTADVDNAPVSVLEAMAAGLCVVSTSVGGIPFLLRDERDALLVPRNDAVAMTAAVERVLGQPELAERLSLGAHAVARAHDWGRVLEQWDTTLRRIAG